MRIIRAKNYDDMSAKAAMIISSQVVLNPESVLGLATGSTVEGVYDILADQNAKGEIDFSGVKTVNLDEYVGLAPDHDQSYRYYMNTNFFDRINIDKSNTNVPNGMASDIDAECKRYNSLIESFGRTDLQLLGLGNNGHIAFNEPDEEFVAMTHCVDLTEDTIQSNSRFFEKIEDVPKQALTMGIKNIVQAKLVLLCVSGKGKADAVKKVLTGPINPQVPGSVLQLHSNLIVVADEDALSEI